MLPFHTAAGHNLYAKFVYIYLRQMLEVNSKHADVLELFKKGFHVIDLFHAAQGLVAGGMRPPS